MGGRLRAHRPGPARGRDDRAGPPRARSRTAPRVVVKVQRPDAKEQIEQDLALLEVFAEKVGSRQQLRQVIDMPAVFEHLSTSLHRELDFRQEARNMERLPRA